MITIICIPLLPEEKICEICKWVHGGINCKLTEEAKTCGKWEELTEKEIKRLGIGKSYEVRNK